MFYDFVQKVFLCNSGTFDSVTLYKFRMMVAMIQNLNINWARVLLKLLSDEVDLIVDVEKDGKSTVEVKKSLRICTKIS